MCCFLSGEQCYGGMWGHAHSRIIQRFMVLFQVPELYTIQAPNFLSLHSASYQLANYYLPLIQCAPLCPERSYSLIFPNSHVRKENDDCGSNCSGICDEAVFQWQNCTSAPMAILTCKNRHL